jgi:spore coat polysaccharide biosynthesis protein SpsF
VLLPIVGEPMLARQIARLRRSSRLDKLVVVTSTDPTDDAVAELAAGLGVDVFRGSLDNVLSRFCGAIETHKPNVVVRLTGDCPLADPDVVDLVIAAHLAEGTDYTANTLTPTFPDGLDVECIRPAVLVGLNERELSEPERQHVTYGVYTRPREFTLSSVTQEPDRSHLRWTVDTPSDLEFVRAVFEAFPGREDTFGQQDVIDWLSADPSRVRTDSDEMRNAGLQRDLDELQE